MDESIRRIFLLIKLLSQNTSQSVVKDYLKENGLPKSFKNWNTLYEDRIKEGLKLKKISEKSLHDLLEDAEEHGRQHIFLYKIDPALAKKLMDEQRIQNVAKDNGLLEELDSFSIEEIPDNPKVTNIRFEEVINEENVKEKSIVIKIVEKRESRQYLSEDFTDGIYTKKYSRIIERGINSARLRESGLLEIRIGSHKDSSNYLPDLARVFRLIRPFIPKDNCSELSLSKALNHLNKDHKNLAKDVRYSHFGYKNEDGINMRLACGSEDKSVTDSKGAVVCSSSFTSNKGNIEKMNIWFRETKSNVLDNDLHVLFSGMINEYAIPAQCRKKEYEFVLNKLLTFNK